MAEDNREFIAVLDFGGQYAHLIANRVRRLGVYASIHHSDCAVSEIKNARGIIFSGGPSSVYAADAPPFNKDILNLEIPMLGICYGHQLISQTLGGSVKPGKVKEYGTAQLTLGEPENPLLKGIPFQSPMWMSHGDKVETLAPGFRIIASTDDCEAAVVVNDTKRLYGIQFHPEVTHSTYGSQLMSNFTEICGCAKSWSMRTYLDEVTTKIQSQAGSERNVFLLVSGGVDSTVAFVMLNKILGKDRVMGLHIDSGTMRLGESSKVVAFLKEEGMDNLRVVDATPTFLDQLKNLVEPEAKRKAIGETFLKVKDSEIAKLKLDPDKWILAQGTIYPDTIESGGTKNADVIKTHHNRVAGIMDLLKQGKIIEPLAELYKDEVRALGEELGLPRELVWRHPFPGPGLGVRLLCSHGEPTGHTMSELTKVDSWLKLKNVNGTVLPIKSVGVQGDARSYAQPLVLQESLEWSVAEQLSTEATNRFPEVNRVVMQVGPPPNQSRPKFKVIKQYCEKDPLDFLRKIDDVCTTFLYRHGLYEGIWQMPVVLLPLCVDGESEIKRVVVLRPVNSSEAMTANFAQIPANLLTELWNEVKDMGVGAILYDVTHKPPGTIEWE